MAFLTRFLCLLFLLAAPIAQAAESLELTEQKIKAGLVYNFLKYVEWPDSAFTQSSGMQVCLLGGDPFGGNLNPMQGRSVNHRAIAVRRIDDAESARECHLLVIDVAHEKKWPSIKAALNGASLLTVSDFEGFAGQGGMIEFKSRESRVEVEMNRQAVAQAGLKVEDRLLSLVTLTR